MKSKEYRKAISELNKAEEVKSDYYGTYVTRGLAFAFMKEYDRSLQDFQEAIRLNKEAVNAYNNRSYVWNQIGEYDRAIADANNALEINVDYANPYNHRGFAYEQKGELAKAERDYRRSLDLDPSYERARRNLARLRGELTAAALTADDQEAEPADGAGSPASSAAGTAPIETSAPAATQAYRSERRMALVIGNGAYASGPLANPPSDARAMASTLGQLGFEVRLGLDLTNSEMLREVIEFGRSLRDGGVGLFYYAGHAIQLHGKNYLIPIDAEILDEDYVPVETLDLDQVLWRMGGADNRLNVIILDACRNNPFARRFRSVNRGLAPAVAPSGVFIGYATAPGAVALDSDDDRSANSPYTEALLSVLSRPSLKLEEVFKLVLEEVKDETNGFQTPWYSSSVTGDFYFNLPGESAS